MQIQDKDTILGAIRWELTVCCFLASPSQRLSEWWCKDLAVSAQLRPLLNKQSVLWSSMVDRQRCHQICHEARQLPPPQSCFSFLLSETNFVIHFFCAPNSILGSNQKTWDQSGPRSWAVRWHLDTGSLSAWLVMRLTALVDRRCVDSSWLRGLSSY